MFRTALAITVALAATTGFAQHEHGGTHSQPSVQAATEATESDEAPGTGGELSIGSHGGAIQQVGSLTVEPVVEASGLKLFVYDDQGQPVELNKVRGVATLQVEAGAKRYRYDLFPDINKGNTATSLVAAVDLSRFAASHVSIDFQIIGLPGEERGALKFTSSSQVPLTEAQQVAAAIEAQEVCPVSGQPLGSMGAPIAVTVGNDTMYVCCAGCVDKAKADFSKYLAMTTGATGKVPPGSEEVRPGVYKVSASDQPFIAAQKNCPVMDEPLGGMGAPLKVHANGQAIYICCAGCAKKIADDPDKYLKILADQGVTPPEVQEATADHVAPPAGKEVRPGVFKVTADDKPFVAAQKLCPVMDESLDGMGGPYRVDVEGQAVYICCPGCAKKLQADPAKYLAKLKEQGITAPAVK